MNTILKTAIFVTALLMLGGCATVFLLMYHAWKKGREDD